MAPSPSPQARTARDWFDAGMEFKRAGNPSGALDAFRRSIKLNSCVAAPWIGLADLLDANSQLEDARQCLIRAVQAEARNPAARLRLASSHKALGFTEEARREYDTAIQLAPHSAPAHFGLGQLLEDIAEPEDAAAAYRRALEIDETHHEALASLLGLGRHVDISKAIETAKSRMATEDAPGRSLLGYGLGKAFDHQKRYADAFDAYAAANEARREASGPFDRKVFDRRLEQLMSVFSRDLFEERAGWGDASQRPVFIVGLPRSGTTLTEQIISSHPQCFGAGELNVLTDLATGMPDRLGRAEPAWPDCARLMDARHAADAGADYLRRSSARAPGEAMRVVDKQPLNFWHLGLVAMALPNARIIHCTRDIRDCGFSIYAHNFNAQQAWSTDLEDIAYYWRGYRRLMDHWKSVTRLQFIDVRYEDTVADLEGGARSLLSFLDLPWDEQVLRYHENDRAVQTPSRWQVRQPVYTSSMARWHHYKSELAPLIKAAEDAV